MSSTLPRSFTSPGRGSCGDCKLDDNDVIEDWLTDVENGSRYTASLDRRYLSATCQGGRPGFRLLLSDQHLNLARHHIRLTSDTTGRSRSFRCDSAEALKRWGSRIRTAVEAEQDHAEFCRIDGEGSGWKRGVEGGGGGGELVASNTSVDGGGDGYGGASRNSSSKRSTSSQAFLSRTVSAPRCTYYKPRPDSSQTTPSSVLVTVRENPNGTSVKRTPATTPNTPNSSICRSNSEKRCKPEFLGKMASFLRCQGRDVTVDCIQTINADPSTTNGQLDNHQRKCSHKGSQVIFV